MQGQHVGLGMAETRWRRAAASQRSVGHCIAAGLCLQRPLLAWRQALPRAGTASAFVAGLSLQWPLLAWRQALPRAGAASPRSSASRCVWIEKESINSVIISDSPEDTHQRLLVAASLSVNTTGE